MTLPQAQAIATFPIVLPATDLANTNRLTGVWAARYAADDSQVALQFDAGALAILENSLGNPDPNAIIARYQEDAANMNQAVRRTVFSVVTVASTPMLVAQPNSDANQSNPASVEFAVGSVDVVLLSSTYGDDELLTIAQSMVGAKA